MNRIREAIEVLARRGWTKDTFTDETGRHCLQGALYEAHGMTAHRARYGRPLPGAVRHDIQLINEVLREQYPERFGGVGVSRFNDHPETTVDDVVRILEKAAVRYDEGL